MEEGKNVPRLCAWRCRLVHNYRKLRRIRRGWKSECAVFLKVHKQPIVIVIVINSRYSHLQGS